MTISTLATLLGLLYGLPQLYALVQPEEFKAVLRKFSRSMVLGYLTSGIATVWFLYNLQQENIADFAVYKKYMFAGFAGLGLGTCIYLRDFLAVRGFAVMLLLAAKLVCDTARWADTPLRLFLITWAYVWVIVGMWWTISPWRCRDWLDWNVSDDARFKILSGVRLGFSIFLVVLGLTVFRG